MNLQRGYLPDGKDRQHPVRDPDDREQPMQPALWVSPHSLTWYQLSGVRVVPPATVIPEEPDNG